VRVKREKQFLRRVALLGIAQRQIRIKYAQKSRNQQRPKPLPASIKTLGDWIQVKRMEKNLSTYHLAAKMGIATALVRAWEDGNSQPDNQQLKVLANVLGFDPAKDSDFAAFIFPHEPEKEPAACRTGIEAPTV
jgi:ribosome-binding protein aMBF1 (putative translation factor)